MKKSKRNPYVVEYGYHLTHKKELSSILEKGLLPKYRGLQSTSARLYNIQKDVYKSIRPIYFLTTPDIEKLTFNMKEDLIYYLKYDIILKVEVSNYNQIPDYNCLILDYGFDYKRRELYLYPHYHYSFYEELHELLKILNKYKNDYQITIPLKELKQNEKLQKDLINFTKTFCIDEPIPAYKIKEIIYL